MERITLAQALKRYFGALDREFWLGLGPATREIFRVSLEKDLNVEIVKPEDKTDGF